MICEYCGYKKDFDWYIDEINTITVKPKSYHYIWYCPKCGFLNKEVHNDCYCANGTGD